MDDPNRPRDTDSGDRTADQQGPLIYQSDVLFQGRNEVLIEHDSEMYRLRKTGKGRLYLTK